MNLEPVWSELERNIDQCMQSEVGQDIVGNVLLRRGLRRGDTDKTAKWDVVARVNQRPRSREAVVHLWFFEYCQLK